MSDFNTIEEIVEDLQAGKMVVLVDERAVDVDGTEFVGEGELMMAAERADAEAVNFLARHAGGPLYAPVSKALLGKLGLDVPLSASKGPRDAAVMLSVNAAVISGPGVSAQDRATTVKSLVAEESTAADFVQPGQVSPLQAQQGGVLKRAGHTEASVDLMHMADLRPVALIAAILDDEGNVAATPYLLTFAVRHGFKIASIRDLIAYRRRTEKLIELEAKARMPTRHGDFEAYAYRSVVDGNPYVALVMGDVGDGSEILVRMHSCCVTGDALGSHLCDCGDQLERSFQMIADEGRGVIVYIQHHEGRGIGVIHKIKAYELQQEKGLDTIEANHALGLPADARDYGVGAQVLYDLGLRRVRFLTNNPRKRVGLEGYGLTVVEQVPIVASPNPHNIRYLQTKRDRMGHTTLFDSPDLGEATAQGS